MKIQQRNICESDAALARKMQKEEETILEDANTCDKLLTTTNDEQLAIAVQQNEYELQEDAKVASRLYQRQVEEYNRKDARKQLGIPSKEDEEERWINADWEDPKIKKKLQKLKEYREAPLSTTSHIWDKITFDKPKKRKEIRIKRRKVMRNPKNLFNVVDNEGVTPKGPIPTQVTKERIKKKLMQ